MDTLLLVEECYNKLPYNVKAKPWLLTDHGKKVLQSDDELNAYIAAYGEMHIVKCRAALQSFPYKELDRQQYEIFDWGCGQCLATLTFIEMLKERNLLSGLKRISLIEPSLPALSRAIEWIKQNTHPNIEIVPINSYIPNNENALMPDVFCSTSICINLFSNILDIENLSLEWLANKTATLANTNYMVCIGPKLTQNNRTRITDFCGYFNPAYYFSEICSFPYSYTSRTHHAYGCETKCFVHTKSEPLNSNYKECSINDPNTDPYDYITDLLYDHVDSYILKFYSKLRESSEQTFDIFFRPIINCDTVDFILTSKTRGILLINICENIDELEEAYNRIETVKSNMFCLHLKSIKINSIIYSSVYNCIKTALYFPSHTQTEIEEKIQQLNKKNTAGDNGTKNRYAYLHKFTDSSNLKSELNRIYSFGFKSEYYQELVEIISSKWHSYKDGDPQFHLTQKQEEIAKSDSKRIRIKGVAGCGKTQVVANRAVYQHLKTGKPVLIITFNISLIQYIRMRINQVPADFSPNMFEIINYHQFFKSKANQYINTKIKLADFDNPHFFDPYKDKINKYQSIIIDEVQDFKEPWLQSIISNFLCEDGSVSLFGDGEQNIYNRDMEKDSKMPPIKECGFMGRWNEMSERISKRIINPQIAALCSCFAKSFLDKNLLSINIQDELTFEPYYIQYWNINSQTPAKTLASIVIWIISKYKLKIKDTVVLGQQIKLLQEIEHEYVKISNLKTMINFETLSQHIEVMQKSFSTYRQKDLDEIRRAAKTHFTTDCDEIKISTIHSFKGWESKNIILFIQQENPSIDNFDSFSLEEKENIPALIYTAMTRAKCNLFIINLDNSNYHRFFSNNIPK